VTVSPEPSDDAGPPDSGAGAGAGCVMGLEDEAVETDAPSEGGDDAVTGADGGEEGWAGGAAEGGGALEALRGGRRESGSTYVSPPPIRTPR
jgi:hypothetical protein